MSTPSIGGRAALILPALSALAVVLSLTGCGASYEASYSSAPTVVAVEPGDYVYYPGDEVYYDNTARVYVYREHDHWVRRPEPPHAFVRSSTSVHVDFHDSPEHHHTEVIKNYPKTWKPKPKPEHKDRDHDHDHDRDHDNH